MKKLLIISIFICIINKTYSKSLDSNISIGITNVTICNVDQETINNYCYMYGIAVNKLYFDYFRSSDTKQIKFINGYSIGYECKVMGLNRLYITPTIGLIKITDKQYKNTNTLSNIGFIFKYFPYHHVGIGLGTNSLNKYSISLIYKINCNK